MRKPLKMKNVEHALHVERALHVRWEQVENTGGAR
jgi:hypothetical protein